MKDNRSHKTSVGGGLYESIFYHLTSIENLFVAWREFKRGKTKKADVIVFEHNLEDNIFKLRETLLAETWVCDGYKKFSIKDPKSRIIHKATVRDRLLHHAIYRILYPYFDKKFISDSYSCRLNKGTHKALERVKVFSRKVSKNNTKQCWILKCDIKKFFASVDHQKLMEILRKHIEDREALWLLERIIASFVSKVPFDIGLPLGNLTSQLLVNVYMHEFDMFVKQEL
ncbi:MAG: reverse transcriptase/maturase family protein, partial [Patescibacteria group bacterium]